jgi:hypothetical protein
MRNARRLMIALVGLRQDSLREGWTAEVPAQPLVVVFGRPGLLTCR